VVVKNINVVADLHTFCTSEYVAYMMTNTADVEMLAGLHTVRASVYELVAYEYNTKLLGF
jgi:hypothetical protein